MMDRPDHPSYGWIDQILADVRVLYGSAPAALRRRMGLLVIILVGSAIAELLSIGAVVPLLKSLSAPHETMHSVGAFLGLPLDLSPREFQLATVGIFCCFTILAGLVRSALVTQTARITFTWATYLSVNTYSKVILQPYAYHIRTNSSDVIGALTKSQMIATSLIMPVIQAFTSAVMIVGISIFLLWITSPLVIMVVLAIIGVYAAVVSRIKSRMMKNGGVISRAQNQRVRAVSESLGAIRDIIIDQTHDRFINRYAEIERNLRNAQQENSITSSMPRIIIETGGMVMIAMALLAIINEQGGIGGALPILGVLALGAQRVLPLAQQVYVGVVSLATNGPMVSDLSQYLGLAHGRSAEPAVRPGVVGEFCSIVFRDVGYRYEEAAAPTFQRVSFSIDRGQRIGVIGPTGGGKSTLIDLLAGLLEPFEGCILIDDDMLRAERLEAWHQMIALVPQHIYLADVSIAENIAVGVPALAIDHAFVHEVLAKAHLDTFIASLPDGVDTRVGERGVNLSGGQLQRLGIARALYKRPKLLILDEATSALDVDTEQAVMKEIYNLDPELTIVMSAHRRAVLHGADKILEVRGGLVTEVSESRQ